MKPDEMLYQMCHTVLSSADIKAICKSRGFSEKEANSRSLFENFFLSSTGVEAAMSTLTPLEVVTLHLLHYINQTVDVTFFERLYGGAQAGSRRYGTFTQQFKPIFDSVATHLIRKGLLLIAEASTNSTTKTKMELWRYHFPPEFAPYLPSPFTSSVRTDEVGTVQADRIRAALLALPVQGNSKKASFGVTLKAGTLFIDQQPFSLNALNRWQAEAWDTDMLRANLKATPVQVYNPNVFLGYTLREGEDRQSSPIAFVIYALQTLAEDEWVTADQFDPLLDIFYGTKTHPTSKMLCESGYENGCLARYIASNSLLTYRLPDARHSPMEVPSDTYLNITSDGKVQIELEKIPYADLAILNQIVAFDITSGHMQAVPDTNKLIDASDSARNHPLRHYLETHSKIFREAFKKFDAAWGKLIIHDNLLVARVTDLSLRVKLQKTFEEDTEAASAAPSVIFLPGDYIAFPRNLLGEVEKVVKKAGHIVKTVQAR